MNVDMIGQQAQALQRRIVDLYQQASVGHTPDLVAKAFDELQYALEQLHSAQELLRHQQQEIDSARDAREQERQHTADVFNGVPLAYVITGIDGTIRRVNSTAAKFFNLPEKFLVGKSFGLFIPEGERRAFRNELERLRGLTQAEERTMRLQPDGARPADVILTVGTGRDRAGRVVALHWLLHRALSRRESEAARRAETYVHL